MQNHHDTKAEFTIRGAWLGLIAYAVLAIIIAMLVAT